MHLDNAKAYKWLLLIRIHMAPLHVSLEASENSISKGGPVEMTTTCEMEDKKRSTRRRKSVSLVTSSDEDASPHEKIEDVAIFSDNDDDVSEFIEFY